MAKTQEKTDAITLIAQVLAGLQAPASMGGPRLLGAAYEPWAKLRDELRLFGYPDAEAHEKALRELLTLKAR